MIDDELLAAVQICDGEEITERRFRREEFRNARCLQEAQMGFQKRQIHLRRSWCGSSGGNESLNLTGSCLSRLEARCSAGCWGCLACSCMCAKRFGLGAIPPLLVNLVREGDDDG